MFFIDVYPNKKYVILYDFQIVNFSESMSSTKNLNDDVASLFLEKSLCLYPLLNFLY